MKQVSTKNSLKKKHTSYNRFAISAWMALVLIFCLSASAQAGESDSTFIVCFKSNGTLAKSGSRADIITNLRKELDENISLFELETGKIVQTIDPLWIIQGIIIKTSLQEAAKICRFSNVASVVMVSDQVWIEGDFNGKNEIQREKSSVEWGIEKVRAPEVWKNLGINGSGVVVGHIDTGIDASHPALKGKVLAFKDFTRNAKPDPYDDNGHGTHTSGTIAGSDGVGMAPGARLIVAKALDSIGLANEADLLKAMQWLADPDGNPNTNDAPRIISNSWSKKSPSSLVVFWKAVQTWVDLGIIPVFSSGNFGPNGKIGIPGSYPHSWTVAGTTKDDQLANFCSPGPVVWDGITTIKPDISAPGEGIVSCAIGGGYVSESGTSMAVPHVSGLVALMLQGNPKLTVQQVRTIAESTCLDLSEPGKDNSFGAGRFDAYECVSKAKTDVSLTASFNVYENALMTEFVMASSIDGITPLSRPLALYIIDQGTKLSDEEYERLSCEIIATGRSASTRLLNAIKTARRADELIEFP